MSTQESRFGCGIMFQSTFLQKAPGMTKNLIKTEADWKMILWGGDLHESTKYYVPKSLTRAALNICSELFAMLRSRSCPRSVSPSHAFPSWLPASLSPCTMTTAITAFFLLDWTLFILFRGVLVTFAPPPQKQIVLSESNKPIKSKLTYCQSINQLRRPTTECFHHCYEILKSFFFSRVPVCFCHKKGKHNEFQKEGVSRIIALYRSKKLSIRKFRPLKIFRGQFCEPGLK